MFLAEKIVEGPVTQTQGKTPQVVNTSVQHVVDTLEVEKHIIHEKINQVTRHAETPLLQIVKKTIEVPEIQTVPAEVPELQVTDKVVDIPVVAQRQIRMNRKVQKTMEIPQLQHTDDVVDVPVVLGRAGPTGASRGGDSRVAVGRASSTGPRRGADSW